MPLPKYEGLTNYVRQLDDHVKGGAEAVKYAMDRFGEEFKEWFNNTYLPAWLSTENGNSGADNVGATPILPGADTVQKALEALLTQIQAATIGQIPDGTITDAKLSNQAGQIKSKVTALENNLSEIEGEVDSHKAENATNAHLAKNISLEDVEGNFEADDLEGAMAELFTSVSDGKDLISGAITDVDPKVEIPTNPTFSDLATAIGQISTGIPIVAGDSQVYKDTSSFTIINDSAAKKVEYQMKFKGSVRVGYTVSNGSNNTTRTQVFINDVEAGTLRSTSANTTTTYTEDFSISAGDKVQIYGYRYSGTTAGTLKDITFSITFDGFTKL